MKVLEKVVYCVSFGIVFPIAFLWAKLFKKHYLQTVYKLLTRRLTDRARYQDTITMIERKL